MKRVFVYISALSCIFVFMSKAMAENHSGNRNGHIKVATYNIQFDRQKSTENRWEKRNLILQQLLSEELDFDIMGTQEPYRNQIEDMMEYLGDRYHWTGVDIHGKSGRSHHNAIFYRKDRFSLLDNGYFWFSDTPSQASKWHDSTSVRNCNWALFLDNHSGEEFYHFNCHLSGNTARESAQLLIRKIAEIAGGKPVCVTGDFNSDQYSEGYSVLVGSEVVVDSYDIATEKFNPDCHSDNRYRYVESPQMDPRRIDHIFVARGTSVNCWRLVNKGYDGRYPSDHFPLIIQWCIPKSE